MRESLTSTKAWRDLAELVYAELAESKPSLINGPVKDIAGHILTAIHGKAAPRFADDLWTARGGRYIDSRLMYSEVGAPKSNRKFNVVISGGGPVGEWTVPQKKRPR